MPPEEQGLGFDLELDAHSRLMAVGAIRGDREFHRSRSTNPHADLLALDAFAADAPFVYGHNILWHDLPWLAKAAPALALHQKPAIDTLVLSAIAFAEHPYHNLLKDYKLVRSSLNDPVSDSRLAHQLLLDAKVRLTELGSRNPTFLRVVRTLGERGLAALRATASAGFDRFFAELTEPSSDLDEDLRSLLAERACTNALQRLFPLAGASSDTHLALLFAVAWLRVAGTHEATSHSVVMPWVRRQLPRVTSLLHDLRDVPCGSQQCAWCTRVHDPVAQLQRWFQYPAFRATPALKGDPRPAQRAIVEAGFAERPHLALLPTGGGKSLCFQLPAIHRYLCRGSLTVVISPLQSLMHDQVENFVKKTNAQCAVAITGRLTGPERRAALDAVRTGQAGILYVSPEQLRNTTFAKTIAVREIGAWVFDEAHCVSKWGHDFRPDYLYAARFVREFSQRQGTSTAPVVCVTATAKPEVRSEILEHFQRELGQELLVFDGHAPRQNLDLRVESLAAPEKIPRLRELVAGVLTASPVGSVLVYAATRSQTESTAAALSAADIPAEAFHAGLEADKKKAVQERFLSGASRVVCATNAFGMGIDKPDIRLVVHFHVPGSLEAYVQEVGRAGRDGLPAEAVLLFATDDIETQFRMASQSRLDRRDLNAILRRIRCMARPDRADTVRETICTTGEILRDDSVAEVVDPDAPGASTRVLTAIAWLERGKFLRRDENATTVFQGRPLVRSIEEAKARIGKLHLPEHKQRLWLAVLARLMDADLDDGISSDDLLSARDAIGVVHAPSSEHAGRAILRLLAEMQKAGLLSSGVLMTAFVRHGVVDSSITRLERAIALELRILELLREQDPDATDGESRPLSLRALTHALTHLDATTTVVQVQQVLASIADRAKHASQAAKGLGISFLSHDHCRVRVRGSWDQIVAIARRRHAIASLCLQTLLGKLAGAQARGASLLVEFSLEELLKALQQDLLLRSEPDPDPATSLEYALLFLHRMEVLVLHKGLAVFRQAMALRIEKDAQSGPYTKENFEPLGDHQDERVVQIHAMHEFALRMQEDVRSGLALLDDYFELPKKQFLERYFRHRLGDLQRATSPESWRRIVKDLSKDQRRVVEANDHESLLVLAGPGSGKTRVVVHRCAYLLRVKRVPARSILVLCFNRSAALELRRRLHDLVGDDSKGVLVQTYHGMAARLLGRSPADFLDAGSKQDSGFDELMRAAVALLESGASTSPEAEGDDLRDRLLTGFRHILVDEYQDIDEVQYALVSAIAGRTLRDPDRKLAVLAVGDDDQNIYEFRHASVEFLRRFEIDYASTRVALVENYRSTSHVIEAAHRLIAQNQDRMKHDAPIRIDAARAHEPRGGRFAGLDPVGKGRVQVLEVGSIAVQALAVVDELRRLRSIDPEFAPDRCAILSPRHALLDSVRTALEREGTPMRRRLDPARSYSLFRLREVQSFLAATAASNSEHVDAAALRSILGSLRQQNPRELAFELVEQTFADFVQEHGEQAQPKTAVLDFFGEVLQEQRRERAVGNGVLLSTVHGCKGTEHDHVFVLDGGWQLRGRDSWEQLRRLYYVGMTRAKQTLTLMQLGTSPAPWLPGFHGDCFQRRRIESTAESRRLPALRYELLSLADLWLSFGGRAREHEEIDRTVRSLATGDQLTLEATDHGIFLQAENGVRVGAIAKAAAPRVRDLLPRILSVRIAAIVMRRRSDESADYQGDLRRDDWHVVIPEFTTTGTA